LTNCMVLCFFPVLLLCFVVGVGAFHTALVLN